MVGNHQTSIYKWLEMGFQVEVILTTKQESPLELFIGKNNKKRVDKRTSRLVHFKILPGSSRELSGFALSLLETTLTGKCLTPTQLLICSSFSRETGHLLLICSSLSTSQLKKWRNPESPRVSKNPQQSLGVCFIHGNGWCGHGGPRLSRFLRKIQSKRFLDVPGS